MVRAYDPLEGDLLQARLIKTFQERSASRHEARVLVGGLATAEEEQRYAVLQIRASRQAVVASVGTKILAWQAIEVLNKGKRTSLSFHNSGCVLNVHAGRKQRFSSGRMSSRSERGREDFALREQVQESQQELIFERAQHRQRFRGNPVMALPDDLGNLTESEALEYALMLSRDAEEERQRLEGPDFYLDELEFMHLDEGSPRPSEPDLDWDESFDHSQSSPNGSMSPPSMAPSPSLSAVADPRARASPRLSPIYPAQSPLGRHMSPPPDMSEANWPLPAASTSSFAHPSIWLGFAGRDAPRFAQAKSD